ncbi:hypothetical protein [Novosphingobium colocasiae]|uniref:Uncharacterized protein n=1 Tax=Novosphingobium colocasiae TaxID=1256513 RepID=A0A918PB39_9SPHN|nr:hypothetical protein [Novosphingobium colocasiae]GGY93595.1 hypothetical protein GCM10011614_05690 [Novosphingobium colocasiae]
MHQFTEFDSAERRDRAMSKVLLLLFGFAVLGFFVLIDRVDWLSIRPATGTSIALSVASSVPSEASSSDQYKDAAAQ